MLTAFILASLLTLKATPLQAFAPVKLTIQLSVEPKPDNRFVIITLDNGEYMRSTQLSLEGDKSTKTQPPFEFRDIPPGDYELRATLYDNSQSIVDVVRLTVHVIGS